ncbi:AMP-dependent synthetase/ligase [Halostreptopolyspora alba]|uniref:Acyl-CoA synthetase n=1 Tax=Halostreptopolyspora alba TaxID=2487137 RepID=A0A3N0E305_9ACTN|nr:long-chain fatty acid--CoA ligase [Nocardiopsaceae bacterium YIM 96095]
MRRNPHTTEHETESTSVGDTLPSLLLRNATEYPNLPALSWRCPDGTGWSGLTWAEVRQRVVELAEGYASLGVEPGEQVLLMMGNRPEHWLSDLALVHMGAVPTTVYSTASAEQVSFIARHSRARVAVVESPDHAARWDPLVSDDSAPLERVVVVDTHGSGGGGYEEFARLPTAPFSGAAERWRSLSPDSRLTVVYTSGTTGDPKGVVITHRNVLSNAVALDRVTQLPPHADHVCYLPLAHIAERMLGLYLPIFRASHVWMCDDPQAVAGVLYEVRPPQFFGVPRVWEKLTSAMRSVLDALPESQRAEVDRAMAVAAEHVDHRERGEEVPSDLEERYEQARSGVLAPILARVGLDRIVWAASASAPMPLEVVRFWAGMGIVIMDAWGLTESVGVATANSPRTGFRLGSVGRPVDCVEVCLSDDSEVHLRGDSVFDGYLEADGSIRSATDEYGWFATGDVGSMDRDGYLWITDRKKELIVTSSGKNISPALVENALKRHPLIGQALVHGDGRPYLVALLVLDSETAPAWARARGIDVGEDWDSLVEHPRVRAEVDNAVAAANQRLNRAEQVKRYRLLTTEWGPETGELTPSLKLRRRVIHESYEAELNALYET